MNSFWSRMGSLSHYGAILMEGKFGYIPAYRESVVMNTKIPIY